MEPLALASVTRRFLAAFTVLLQGQFNFTFTFFLIKPARHHTNCPWGNFVRMRMTVPCSSFLGELQIIMFSI